MNYKAACEASAAREQVRTAIDKYKVLIAGGREVQGYEAALNREYSKYNDAALKEQFATNEYYVQIAVSVRAREQLDKHNLWHKRSVEGVKERAERTRKKAEEEQQQQQQQTSQSASSGH